MSSHLPYIYNVNRKKQIEIVRGDITRQPDADVIVNAANAMLTTGGGVAGAIHKAAGPQLEQACKQLAPIVPGQAVITSAFNLPNKYVIHCLGPVYGQDKPESRLLAHCYRNALMLADKYQLKKVAFPAISTGIFGYPLEDAAEITLKTMLETLPKLEYVKTARLVLFSESDHITFTFCLKKLTQ